MTAGSARTAAPAPAEGLRSEFEAELRHEDEGIFFPLLDRVVAVAQQLEEGKPVDPAYIQEGMALWERYATEVHAERVRLLSGIFGEPAHAKGASPTKARRPGLHLRRSPASESAVSETPWEGMSQILADQTRMAERKGTLANLLVAYARNQYWAREMLASLLRSSAFSDRAWAQYEEDFVTKFFDETLDAAAEAKLRSALSEAREHGLRLGGEIRAYVDRPVPMTQLGG